VEGRRRRAMIFDTHDRIDAGDLERQPERGRLQKAVAAFPIEVEEAAAQLVFQLSLSVTAVRIEADCTRSLPYQREDGCATSLTSNLTRRTPARCVVIPI